MQAQQHAQHNVFTAKKVKLALPPVYNGERAKLGAWLFQVEQYCTMVAVSSDTDKVKLAVTRLEKDALTWWR